MEVASAPLTFQRKMEKILQGKTRTFIWATSLPPMKLTKNIWKTWMNYLLGYRKIAIKLPPKGMNLWKNHWSICDSIFTNRAFTLEDEIESIINIQDPKNVDELRSLISLVTFFPNMATFLTVLYKLLENKQTCK